MAVMEFSDSVLRIVEQYVKEHMYTSIPARVLNTDDFNAKQIIDVLPVINNVFRDGTILEIPPVLDVPVQFPSAGKGLLSFPIEVGDTVLLVFSMKSIDEWMESRDSDKGTFTPADKRSYALTDAVAVPGLYSKNTNLNPNPTDVELKFLDKNKEQLSSIKMKPNGDLTIDTKNDLIATVGNDATVTAANNVNVNATGGKITLTAGGDIDIAAGGNVNITGTTINLN